MRRKLLLVLTAVFLVSFSFAQDWKANLPQNRTASQLTFYDYQNAFNEYWEPYNVKAGYYTENGVRKKAKGWKQFKRWEYKMEGEINTQTGQFPAKTAQQVYKEFIRNNPQQSASRAANWISLGTDNTTGGYAGIGRVNCVAFHPTDNNTYWIGAPAGGLWKTTDNGSSWTCLTDENNVLGVSSIIIPSNYAISNTIYIGTGDRDAWDNRSIGVLKSTDGGATWGTTGLAYALSSGRMVNKMILDPSDDNTIIAATSLGVYKTTNGGLTWSTQLTSTAFIDLEYKPGTFSTLYGSTENGGIFVSTNSGASWSQNHNTGERIELAVSPDDATIVYAVVAAADAGLSGIYKSTNSGTSFTRVLNGATKNLLGWDADGGDSGGQGWYDLSIASSPTDADIVIVGGVNTWRSTDGGSNWSCITHWSGAPQTIHADKHNHVYRSNGDLFECNDGGIYKSSNNGTLFTNISNGLVISQMYKLSVSQTVSTETITGLQDNGTKLLSGGTWYDVKGGDGMECLIDYSDVNIQYGSYVYGQITKTTDQWNNRTDIEPGAAGDGAWVTPYIIDPVTPATLYAGYSDVYKTTNRGGSWSKISTMNTGDKIRSMAIAPSDNQTLYVADQTTIWKTSNGGGSWSNITGTLPVTSAITYIAVKSDNPNTVWVTIGGYNGNGVFESTNGGTSWTNISAGLPSVPMYTIVENKQIASETHLYVGSELGVYFKKGTDNWIEYNAGMPKVRSGELEIYYNATPANSKLRLASYGRGLWESTMEQEITGLPILTTTAISAITVNSASTGGNITDQGDAPVTERGIVWSTSPSPTTADTKVVNGSGGIGTYVSPISGLSTATTYYVRAYATTSSGTSYGQQEQFTTLCGNITTFPFFEGFEGGVVPPNCWATFRGTNNEGTGYDWSPNGTANTGTGAAHVRYEAAGATTQDWLVTPALEFPAGMAINLSYFERQGYTTAYNSNYFIKISTTSQTDIASFTNLLTYDETGLTTTYAEKTLNLSLYEDQTVYIAFVMEQNNGDDWYLDDITFTTSVACTPPSEATVFSADTENDNDVTVSWTRGTGTSVLVLAKEGSVVDEIPANGVSYTANSAFGTGEEFGTGNFVVANGNVSSVNVTGLTVATDYHFAIFEYNNATGECYNTTSLTGTATTTGTAPVTYCDAGATSSSEMLNGVVFGTINNTTTGLGAAGYQDWTAQSTDIEREASYPIDITLGTPFGQDQCRVWIDWNQNGDFEDLGDLVYESTVGVGPYSGNITVPVTALLGATRMRIRVWDTSAEAVGVNGASCGIESWGEVEDYTVNVTSAVCVPPTITVDPSDKTICNTGNVTFNVAASGTGTLTYLWRKGGVDITGTNSTSYTLTGATSADAGDYTCYITNACGNVESAVATLTVDELIVADAGSNVEICTDAVTLAGNTATPGTGTWTGAGTITDDNLATTGVSSIPAGANTYTWSIVNGTCTSTDDVIITNNTVTTADAGSNVEICTNAVTLAGNVATSGTGTWTGAGTITDDNLATTGVSVIPAGENTYTWSIVNGTCTSTDDVIITNNTVTTADAGSNVEICTDAVTLAGNTATSGTGTWTGTGTIADDNLATTGVSAIPAGATTYTWTIVNGTCTSTDDVIITNNTVTTADAGSDVEICTDAVILAGNTATSGIGTWTGAGTITDDNLATTGVSVIPAGANTYTWSIVNGTCTSTDDVIITNNTVTTADAGSNVEICTDAVTLAGNTATSGLGTWTGAGTITDDNLATTGVSVVPEGANTYTWSIVNGTCTSTDDVIITNNNVTADAGSDVEVCTDAVTLAGNAVTPGIGTWTGAGTITDDNLATTGVSSIPLGVNTYTWSIVNGTCTSTDEVIITNNTVTVAAAGSDVAFCQASTMTLSANTATQGVGTWTSAPASVTFDNANLSNSGVSNMPINVTTFTWSIVNGTCTSSDDMVVTNDLLVTADAGTDAEICDNIVTLAGNSPSSGIGTWTGPGTIADANLATTGVSAIPAGANTFTWTIENGECTDSEFVVLTNNTVTADAGTDQDLCSNDTFLGGTSPTVGNGFWTTTGGALIAFPTQGNSGVSNLDMGLNTFTWDVINGGCTASDEVTVTVGNSTLITTQPVDINTTEGSNVTFSVVAEGDNLSYQWRFQGSDINLETASTLNLFAVTQVDAGDYDVIVSGDCSNVTSTVAVLSVTTSVEELTEFGINVFPNPSNGQFTITIGSDYKNASVLISDVTGKSVYETEFTGNKTTVDLKKAAGIYFVKFNIDGKIVISQIVVR